MCKVPDIQKYEELFFSYDFCSISANLEQMIADDFIEIGASGKTYCKTDIIDYLSHLQADRKISIFDFKQKQLSDSLILVTYQTTEDANVAMRSSIWQMCKDGTVKIIFHQGTKV